MAAATLTSKGQLTVPKVVRDALHLRPGDRLEFEIEEDGTIRVHPLTRRVAEVFGMFAHRGGKPRSPEEMRENLKSAFRGGRL